MKRNAAVGLFTKPSKKGLADVSTDHIIFNLKGNGGRRSGIERRRFSYADHIRERRFGSDRRYDRDRRSGTERRSDFVNRRNSEEQMVSLEDRRNRSDRRIGADRRDFMIL